MLEGYAETDLAALQELPSLTAVRLDRPERLRRLLGVGPGLQRLSVLHAPVLTDVGDIEAATGLRLLELIGSPSTRGLERIGGCTELEELTLSGCGPIPSLGWVRDLRQLRRFELLGATPVVDGDLTPLTDLPALAQVTMQPRPHYRPTVAEVRASLRR